MGDSLQTVRQPAPWRGLPPAQTDDGEPGAAPEKVQSADDILGAPPTPPLAMQPLDPSGAGFQQPDATPPAAPQQPGTLPTADDILGPPPTGPSALDPSGAGFDASPATANLISNSSIGRVMSAFGHGAADAWSTPAFTFDDPATTETLKKTGLLPDLEKGQQGLLSAFGTGVLLPAAQLLDYTLRAGSAVIAGGQAAAEQAGIEAGVPQLGRDVAAMVEAFPQESGGAQGVLVRGYRPPVPPMIAQARDLGVIGGGEAAWKGYEELPLPGSEASALAARVEAAKQPANRNTQFLPYGHAEGALGPETGGAAIQPYGAQIEQVPLDIHQAARQAAPDTFNEYDPLFQRREELRAQIDDSVSDLQDRAEAQAPGHAEIADLERRLQDTTPRLAKKYEERLAELRPAHDAFLADEFTMSALTRDTAEITRMREDLQAIDYRMRDLAPDVSAAYREAETQFPQPEAPVAAPGESPIVSTAAASDTEATPPVPSAPAATPEPTPAEAAPAPQPVPVAMEGQPAVPPVPLNIAADVTRRFTEAGRPADEAAGLGTLLEHYYDSRAGRFTDGTSAADLYRKEGPSVRGAARGGRAGAAAGKTLLRDGHAVITLFEKADASTALHEIGHQWLDDLVRDAAHPAATAETVADAKAVRDWLQGGEAPKPMIKSRYGNVRPATDAEIANSPNRIIHPAEGRAAQEGITTRQHEQFARAFERYMYEGRAPTQSLRSVFAKFAGWLRQVYQDMRGLGKPISADIRDVFDRFLTREPDVAAVVAPEAPRELVNVPKEPPRAAYTVPKEPQRLHEFLRDLGGVIDEGGDLESGGAGAKLRPNGTRYRKPILNPKGVPLDEAGLQAFQAGYFDERPLFPELKAAIHDDLNETPKRYSKHDEAALAEYNEAIRRNSEVDRLSHETGVDPTGLTLDEFYEQVAQKMDAADESARLEAEHHAEFGRDDDELRAWAEDHGGSVDDYYGPVTQEEAEDAYRQAANAPATPDVAARGGESGPASGPEGEVQDGGGVGRRGSPPGRRDAGGESSGGPGGVLERGGTPITDKAGNIRFDLLNVPDDVNAAIRAIIAKNNDFLDRRFGDGPQASLEKEIWATQDLVRQTGQNVVDAVAKARQTGSGADIIAAIQANDRATMAVRHLSTLNAMWGRAGNALQRFQRVTRFDHGADLESAIQQATGKTLYQMREELGLQSAITDPMKAAHFAADMKLSRFQRTWNMTVAYVINNYISGPLTHMAYSVGNYFMALEKATVGSFVDATQGAIREAIAGKPVERTYYREIPAQLFAMHRGFLDAIPAAGAALKTGVPMIKGLAADELGLGAFGIRSQTIPGRIGYVLETPSRAVAAIHTVYYAMGYEQEISRMAVRDAISRGLTGTDYDTAVASFRAQPPIDAVAKAHDEALSMVLMKRPPFDSAQYHAAQFVNKVPPLKLVLPFMQIGMNILEKGIVEHTPLAFANKAIRDDLLGHNGPIRQDIRRGKLIVGAGIALGVHALFVEGLLTDGGPSDPDERRVKETTGWKPYSFRGGDTYIPYMKYLGSFGPLIGAFADINGAAVALEEKGASAAAMALATGFGEVVADQSWMESLTGLIDAARNWDTEKGARWARDSAVSAFVPFSSAARQVARLIDPYQRQVRSLADQARNNMPVASESLYPQRDVFGEPVVGHQSLSPSYAVNDPVAQKLLSLDRGISRLERKIRGVELTDQQYDDFQRVAGRLTKMSLGQLFSTTGLSALPPETQRDLVSKTITKARESARSLIMMQNPTIIQQANAAKLKQRTGVTLP